MGISGTEMVGISYDFIDALPNRLLPYEASNDAITGEPMVFDAAGFYAHNECE
jgi:hypothetical protein